MKNIKFNFFYLLAPFFLFASQNVGADSMERDSLRTYDLEAVSVTGSRVPLTLGQSARIVTVLDSMAISSMPAETVNDLLKYAVGADVRQRGGLGVQTDISIRGGTFDQIAVLLDGINISDPHTGHNAADFPVSINDIDRIEIIQGPAARIYGTSSLVGAINIVTRKTSGKEASLHLEGGSYGYLNTGARAGIAKGKFTSHISGNFVRSDGYSRSLSGHLNSDYKGFKTFYNGSYNGKDAIVSWHAGFSGKDFGANTFYSPKFDEQFESTVKTFAAVQAQTTGSLHFKPQIYWNHSRDRFELFRGAPDKYAFNFHKTNVFGINLGLWFETAAGRTAFGAEMRNEGIVSTNLGDPLGREVKVPGYDAMYKKGRNRTNLGYYVEHNIVTRRFTLSAGLTAAANTGNEAGFGLYPGADASLRISDNWKVYASYNSSLRQPTFTELYYSVGGHAADKFLRAEKMQALEGGVKFLRPGIRAILSVYYHHGTDMVDWIADETLAEPVWTSVNHTALNTLGEEFTLRIDLPVLLGREEFFLRSADFGYSHIGQDKKLAGGLKSRYAMEYLRNKLVARVDFRLMRELFLNVSCRYVERAGDYAPYTLLDARLSWTWKNFRVFAEAGNILNKTYYDFGNIPQPGIWLRSGVVYNIF